MLKLKTSPNHSKSLIFGSGSFSSSNFKIFEKINSNRLTLQPRNPKILRNVLCFCPGNFFSFWHYIPIDNHCIDHSYHFWPPNAYTRCAAAHERQVVFSIYEKTVNRKNSWKVSFGSYRGPLQIPIDIGPTAIDPSCHKRTICFGLKKVNYLNGHNSDSSQHRIFCQIYWHLHANLWVKIPNIHCSRILGLFWYVRNSQKLALKAPQNSQSVTYSKIQTKVCRVPQYTPMDWLLIESINAEYPLRCHKCVKKNWTFVFYALPYPHKCVTPPPKWYHHIA